MELTHTEILRYLKLVKEKRYLVIILSLCIISVIVWGSFFYPQEVQGGKYYFY